jgi:hypothetical protein
MLEVYPYLEVGKQLCHLHYCKIVEPNRGHIQYKRKKELKGCSRKKPALESINSRSIEEIRNEGNVININYIYYKTLS